MASASKASLIVAASVAAVEALKDQAGLCRWNYALRSLHGRAKRSMAPFSRAKRMSSSSIDQWRRGGEKAVERARRTEDSMSKIIYLDSWGPK
uniref:Wound-responsive family protein n=1 Tax=Musa acuminata subsp. malaccensis TaxID=214687 RepID=A0A804KQI7_MUSAM